MYVLLNGSFGIGKTTVAKRFVAEVSDAAIYDPERIGFVLRRLPPLLLGLRSQPTDYQDLPLWRRQIARGAAAAHRRHSTVIVPMAFTDLDYLDAFAGELGHDGTVVRLCLVAPLEVVSARLEQRANSEHRQVSEFERRRSEECVRAHADRAFGHPIDATQAPDDIVAAIREAAGL